MMIRMSRRSNMSPAQACHAHSIARLAKRLSVLAAGAVFVHMQGAFAQPVRGPQNDIAAGHAPYQAGSLNSPQATDAALGEISRARSGIEARFADEEQACHSKFFTTSCVDSAKERRRQALAPLRRIELEAEQFKRMERLIAREEAAAERHVKGEAGRRERMRPLRERDNVARAGQPEQEIVRTELVAGLPGRAAEHEFRHRHRAEQDAANAKKRAENVQKYEKKMRAVQARQKKIAEKKAAKENGRRAAQHASPPTAQ